jgi:hypothetical protein
MPTKKNVLLKLSATTSVTSNAMDATSRIPGPAVSQPCTSLTAVTNTSSWVFIQPPATFAAAVKGGKHRNGDHPMHLHIVYLEAAIASWREYFNYIADKLKECVSPRLAQSLHTTFIKPS